jgi:hypothetical protein
VTFAIEIRCDNWEPLVTKIKTKEEAERLLPIVIAQFILSPTRYRVVEEISQ